MPAKRVPDFFVVGHPKTGTSALYQMLRTHPAIFLPDKKEPMFLASELQREDWTWETYLELYSPARADQLAGDASAVYMLSPVAIEAIAELNPDARAIAIFREPAAWIRSRHAQLLKDHVESVRDLRTALALEPLRREGRELPSTAGHRPHHLQYVGNVRYSDQVARLQRALGRDRVHVVIHEDLRSDYESVLLGISRFLGIDDSHKFERLVVNTTERRMRFQGLDRQLRAFTHGTGGYRLTKSAIRRFLPERIRRRGVVAFRERVIFGPVPSVDWQLDRELRVLLKPEVERFGRMIERDLVSLWGYADLNADENC